MADPVLSRENVVACYDFFDAIFPPCGLTELTDGLYGDDPTLPYDLAQKNQIEWLLDQVKCRAGTRLLDVGCGYGSLVEAAVRRGAQAVGITISPRQVDWCRARGLEVRLLDYREVPATWWGTFDAVVANGSAEHFVQPRDVLAAKDDDIYREMFSIFHRLIRPDSPSGRLATTIIHRHEHSPVIPPGDLLKGPWAHRWGTPAFHYAMLQRGFGGFYPLPGQLERCARGLFTKIVEVDGTRDYRITSDECFRRVRRCLVSWRHGPAVARGLLSYVLRRPGHGLLMCCCLFWAESWQWQFRGEEPPVRLLRETWQRETGGGHTQDQGRDAACVRDK